MNRLGLLCLLLVLIGGTSFAQNFSADFARANNIYLKLNKTFHIHSKFMVDSKLIREQKIEVNMRDADHFFMKDENTEVLVRDGLKILVSRNEKAIMVDSNFNETITSLPVSLFDTMSKSYSKIDRIVKDGIITYRLYPKVDRVDVVEIHLEDKTFLIRTIKLTMNDSQLNEKQQVEITYTYERLKEIPAVSMYLKTSPKLQLQPQWSSYELLDYVSTNP